ncbi:MFS transporter [Caballeronia telluris]|uniref:Major facilitator transporter n=1 Tax=Caballeronia telluris TaxID=326475 RepID=A0A158K4R6_9BURK|nr:MFS transporter [Caballeronia telluris]SAL76107.1 major facilitator transporter [Caballeronia telluris]
MRQATLGSIDDAEALADTHAPALNIAGRMERLPLSSFHWTFFAILGVAMFFDGYDLTVTGFVVPALHKHGWLTASTTAAFISLPLIAAAFGSIAAGVIGDRLGRRRLFQASVLVYSLSSLACGFAANYGTLLTFRTINLFAIGVVTVTGYTYLNEFTPRRFRGRFQSAVALLLNGGLPFGALAARVVMPNTGEDIGWRILFLLAVIPALLVFANRRLMPESPRWLVSVGRDREAADVLSAIEARIAARHGGNLPAPEPTLSPVRNLGWDALFSRGVRGRFALAIVFNICHLSGLFVLISWLPTLFMSRGLTLGSTFTFAAVSFMGGFIGPLLGIFLADRFERRWALVVAALVAAGAGIAYAEQTAPAALMGVGLLLVTAIFFISSVGFATYIPEILPTGVRLRGLGTAALIGRLASAITPFAVASALLTLKNPLYVVTSVGVAYVLMAILLALLGPNVRGKSLESLEHETDR